MLALYMWYDNNLIIQQHNIKIKCFESIVIWFSHFMHSCIIKTRPGLYSFDLGILTGDSRIGRDSHVQTVGCSGSVAELIWTLDLENPGSNPVLRC